MFSWNTIECAGYVGWSWSGKEFNGQLEERLWDSEKWL